MGPIPVGPQDAGQMVPPQLNPQVMMQLREAAANGDPRAIAQLQAFQGAQGAQPAQGAAPAGAMPGAGGAPPMTQSQFGNGGAPIPPDVQARRAQQLIQMLRARGGQ